MSYVVVILIGSKIEIDNAADRPDVEPTLNWKNSWVLLETGERSEVMKFGS